MELIRPVAAGPVLNECELQAACLSPEQEQVIRSLFADPQPPVSQQDLDNMIESVGEITEQLQKSYSDLERYEETLVPRGYHPVNKEPLDDSEDE